MKVVRIVGLLSIVFVISLSPGCGGDDGGGDQAATPDTTPTEEGTGSGAAEQTTVRMDEFSYDPEDVVVTRGATITVENAGQVAHNLTVEQGTNPREEGRKLAGTSTFLGGKSEKLEVDLEPGEYAMACTVPGHRESGMTGSFTVESSGQ